MLRGPAQQTLHRLAHDPAIQHRHQIVALGRGNEVAGRYQLAVLVAHAQQQFVVTTAIRVPTDRDDRLEVQFQSLLFDRVADARHPLHLLVLFGHIALLTQVNAVAPLILGRITGHVGETEQLFCAGTGSRDADHPDTGRYRHRTLFPAEAMFEDGLTQIIGHLEGLSSRTVLQQQCELVTADAGQDITGTHA